MKYQGDINPYGVDAVWEVGLRQELVSQIKEVARRYGKSMSWVVRYCVFRLYRKKRVNLNTLHNMAEELRERNQLNPKSSRDLHRLRVCLYGDDERIFLELKYRFRLTVTMLVRIALRLYLGLLLQGHVSEWNFFYYGLKFFSATKVVYSLNKKVPQVDFHFKSFMRRENFWGLPEGQLPNFLLL